MLQFPTSTDYTVGLSDVCDMASVPTLEKSKDHGLMSKSPALILLFPGGNILISSVKELPV